MSNKTYIQIRDEVAKLYPVDDTAQLASTITSYYQAIPKDPQSNLSARRCGKACNPKQIKLMLDQYTKVPSKPSNGDEVSNLVASLFGGVPKWRSPLLMYNVGASVNVAASAAYSLALDENVFNINDGLAGNALLAERAVVDILSKLAGIDTNMATGLFTFGGTATNLYAEKIGINKASPRATFDGLDQKVKILITEDCHFSHEVAADWLGIGKNNVLTIPSNPNRTSNVKAAEKLAREIIESGSKLASIIINGGTTYGHTIDDIAAYVKMRDELYKEYDLDYKPHIHVDSVIGWVWLWFTGYDFAVNPLQIPQKVLSQIQRQYDRIKNVKLADSWGADFHKGLGGCPVNCSVLMINNHRDAALLSKKRTVGNLHQLANEFSFDSPVDFTLETSRSAGPAIAALTSMHSLGYDGYRSLIAGIMGAVQIMRVTLERKKDVEVANCFSDGYVVMVRLIPPQGYSESTEKYNKDFFVWDSETRMSKHQGFEYSYSSSCIIDEYGKPGGALKLYPVSPHLTNSLARDVVNQLVAQKKLFDKHLLLCPEN